MYVVNEKMKISGEVFKHIKKGTVVFNFYVDKLTTEINKDLKHHPELKFKRIVITNEHADYFVRNIYGIFVEYSD